VFYGATIAVAIVGIQYKELKDIASIPKSYISFLNPIQRIESLRLKLHFPEKVNSENPIQRIERLLAAA